MTDNEDKVLEMDRLLKSPEVALSLHRSFMDMKELLDDRYGTQGSEIFDEFVNLTSELGLEL